MKEDIEEILDKYIDVPNSSYFIDEENGLQGQEAYNALVKSIENYIENVLEGRALAAKDIRW